MKIFLRNTKNISLSEKSPISLSTIGNKEAISKAISFYIQDGYVAEKSKVLLGNKIFIDGDQYVDGVYAEWEFDGEEFRFENDRLGFYPIYYYDYMGKFGISTSIIDLAMKGEVPLALDDDALSVFIRLGFFLKNDTPFKHIRCVPPGCTLIWRDGKVEILSARHPSSRTINGMSRDSAAHQYAEIFQSTITRIIHSKHDKIGVPLSGGRDSRHIALALYKAHREVHSYLTINKDHDAFIAGKLARAMCVAHEVLDLRRGDRLELEIRKNVLTSFCSDEHAWILPLSDLIERNGYTAIYDGIGGDVLSAGLFLTSKRLELFCEGRIELLSKKLLRDDKYIKSYMPKVLLDRFNRELAINRLVDELRNHIGAPNPVGQFFFWNRTRREIALIPWSIYSKTIKVVAPFLMRDVYDLLTGLPGEYFLDHKFHDQVINSYYQKYSYIPFENKSNTLLKQHKKIIKIFDGMILIKKFVKYMSESKIDDFKGGYLSQFARSMVIYLKLRNQREFLLSFRMITYLIQLFKFSGGAHVKNMVRDCPGISEKKDGYKE